MIVKDLIVLDGDDSSITIRLRERKVDWFDDNLAKGQEEVEDKWSMQDSNFIRCMAKIVTKICNITRYIVEWFLVSLISFVKYMRMIDRKVGPLFDHPKDILVWFGVGGWCPTRKTLMY